MLKEIFGDLSGMFSDFKPGPKTRTLTVAKPYCAPARDIVMTALQPYGVRVYGYDEETRMLSPRQALNNLRVKASAVENVTRLLDPLPTAQVAEVTVSEKQAAWAEYLLLRTGKLYVPGKYVNKRNADWATRHGGQMPPAWKDGKPWIEQSCSEGKAAWGPIRKAISAQNQKRNRR